MLLDYMPPLAAGYRFAAVNLHQIGRHLDHPILDIFIHDQIIERLAQLRPKVLQRLCAAAAEFLERRRLDRKRPRMGAEIQLQPARQILALEGAALLPVDQRMRYLKMSHRC